MIPNFFQGACQREYIVENEKDTLVYTCATLSICEENKAHTTFDSYWNCANEARAKKVRSDNVLNKCAVVRCHNTRVLINQQRQHVVDECAVPSLENFVMFT